MNAKLYSSKSPFLDQVQLKLKFVSYLLEIENFNSLDGKLSQPKLEW